MTLLSANKSSEGAKTAQLYFQRKASIPSHFWTNSHVSHILATAFAALWNGNRKLDLLSSRTQYWPSPPGSAPGPSVTQIRPRWPGPQGHAQLRRSKVCPCSLSGNLHRRSDNCKLPEQPSHKANAQSETPHDAEGAEQRWGNRSHTCPC